MSTSRNAPCPCGSGRKHKRCCLARDRDVQISARTDDAVGGRMADWAVAEFPREMDSALQAWRETRAEFNRHEIDLAQTWFMSDRPLPDGRTPAEHAAERPGLGDSERDVARRIAAARLGVYRVLDRDPGHWVELEDVLGGTTVRAASRSVSRGTARWDVVLARLMDGPPAPSLWGPCSILASAEEEELLAELERRAGSGDAAAMLGALRRDALAMLTFIPPSRGREPSFRAFDGQPLVDGRAQWVLEDPVSDWGALAGHPELVCTDENRLDWIVPRGSVDRPALPHETIVLEATLLERPEEVCAGAFELDGKRLRFEAQSEQRLDLACALVGEILGARLVERQAKAFDIDRRPRRWRPERTGRLEAAPPAGVAREILDGHYRRWLDEPIAALGGLTPRLASSDPGQRNALERLLRGMENRAERQADGHHAPDWLRGELGMAA